MDQSSFPLLFLLACLPNPCSAIVCFICSTKEGMQCPEPGYEPVSDPGAWSEKTNRKYADTGVGMACAVAFGIGSGRVHYQVYVRTN